MNVVIWQVQKLAGAGLFELEGLPKSFRLSKGVPLLDGFPANVAFRMSPESIAAPPWRGVASGSVGPRGLPHDRGLPDCIDNVKDALLVSARLRAFLEKLGLPKVEVLPVSIVDPEGHVASSTHVIVHPIDPVDCIDLQRSVFDRSELVPDKLRDVTKLVIDPARVPGDRPLFRARGLTRAVFVHRALAEEIRREGFTGVDWIEIERFRT